MLLMATPSPAPANVDYSGTWIILFSTLAVALLSTQIANVGFDMFVRLVSPTSKVSARLASNLAIYKELPEAPQKNEFVSLS